MRRLLLGRGRDRARSGAICVNPQGPDFSLYPSEPDEKKRAHRGGSFLCNDQYCSRYIVGTRDKGEINTDTNHLDFCCLKGAKPIVATARTTSASHQ